MDGMVLVADLSWRHAFLQSLGLSSSAILISATYEERLVPTGTAIACVDVSRKHTTDDVTKMWLIVDVGKCCCYQNISTPHLWQHFAASRRCCWIMKFCDSE